MRGWLASLVLVSGLGAGLPATAQDSPAPPVSAAPASSGSGLTKAQTAGSGSGTKTLSASSEIQEVVDYAAWEALAQRAERAIAAGNTSDNGLELLRGQLVDWRSRLQTAQTANAGRISSLRSQIDALGPAPAEGASEADEIVARRAELNEQLSRLEAPRRAAEEAYRRATGLIAEIDSALRNRKTAQLLRLWPTPANPANWDDAVVAIGNSVTALGSEARANWKTQTRRAEFHEMWPASAIMLAVALVAILRGRRWIERFSNWLNSTAESARWRRVWSFVASLGQVAVPTLGVLLISVALLITDMPGWLGQQVLQALPSAGFVVFLSHWLAGRIFPRGDCASGPLALPPEVCAEARFLIIAMGLVRGADLLREALFPAQLVSEVATPVLALPSIGVLALLLWRFGHLLNRHLGQQTEREEAGSFRDTMIRLAGKLLIVIALVAPALAVIGYVNLAQALIFPAAASLTLIGILMVLVQLIGDIWRAVVGEDEAAQGLLPVLSGFLLTLASLPLFAMLWGARSEYLGELWNRFTEGFMLGETRISPSNFVYLAVLFLIGFGATRLFQGALRSSILPKTKLDQGGRNAIVSGAGYIGIFLSVLIAVSTAGINLSGLAIVASALSVGIGFGLQNIVQNFVSGIILLIERPVSEGDWIEVGGVSGIVQSISVRSTRIQTFDRSDIIVPNGDLVSQRVTNWTRFSMAGRVIVTVGVDYSSDTRKVAQVLREIAESHPMVLLEPPPMAVFAGLGADALNFELRMIIRDVNFSTVVRSEINHLILERFRAEGIELPFSQRDIWLKNPEAVAEALASLTSAMRGRGMEGLVQTSTGTQKPASQETVDDALDTETER
ncbi:MAG TPA: DUF3772 domain-containing protein [Gemmobacter sp.]|nr:DUF3772 domain-containing protein [Gemmobacter sp.]